MIDPRLDILVWAAVLLLLIVMGARAWAVETTLARNYRKSARVRMLTMATGVAMAALAGLMAMQGGILFVQAVVTRTDPETFVTVIGQEDNTDQAVPDPDDRPDQPAAPADPNAPAAGAADPNTPAAPGAGANPGGAPAGQQPVQPGG